MRANLWWIVTWITRGIAEAADLGWWRSLTEPMRILAISTFRQELHLFNPRPLALVLVLAAWTLGALADPRSDTLWARASLGAFLVHAYYTLSVQVHENHLYLAIPLAIVGASATAVSGAGPDRSSPGRLWREPGFLVVAVLTAVLALDLNLFYGFGERVGYGFPRRLTAVDATVVLAVLNVIGLAWHGRVFARRLHDSR